MYSSSCCADLGGSSYAPQTPNSEPQTYIAWQPALEQIVLEQPVAACAIEQPKKQAKTYSSLYLSPQRRDYFTADAFLIHQLTMFVGSAKEIEEFAKEAFEKTTGTQLPQNIIIHVCSKEKIKQVHEERAGRWDESIIGFSFNGHAHRTSEIFVQEGTLDRVMLTLGHELGHVISPTLSDARDEEAKAFAFSLAWMRAIVDNNIAGLANCINPNPAKNGLHDVAFDFVVAKIREGSQPFSLFNSIATRQLSLLQKLEQIIIA